MPKNRQGGLGRGLGSLIPANSAVVEGDLREIPLADIVANSNQPRRDFDEEELVGLANSIREVGLLQPILVRQLEDRSYQLIAGERRWRAASRAGLDRIPAIVRDVDDLTSLAQAIVENVQRAELNAIEEAAAFAQLIEEFSLTQDDVAKQIGRSRPSVANALRLLQLSPELQRHIVDGRLSAGHGRVLAGVSESDRMALAQRVIDQGLSVRALEALARGEEPSEPGPASDSQPPPSGDQNVGETKLPALLELEELLGDRFETKVVISLGPRRGRLTINFADIDDLERIYTRMTVG